MPRKTAADSPSGRRVVLASMRPRPDAAENQRHDGDQRGGHPASMRPRPDAAENNRGAAGQRPGRRAASMRPRPDAAENGPRATAGAQHVARRFNEAAARCRGKHALHVYATPRFYLASMRPRPDAAENTDLTSRALSSSVSFNEAAARCRGKRYLTTCTSRL